jgi:hypothetical protein
MLSMKSNNSLRRSQHRRTTLTTRFFAFVILATVATAGAFAQTTTSSDLKLNGSTAQELTADKPPGEGIERKSTSAPVPSAPAVKAATPPSPLPRKIGGLNFSGSLRLRVENYGWFETPGFDDDYTFGAAVLRLSLGQQKEKYDWQVEGEFPVLFNLPGRAVAPAPQGQLGLGGSYYAANGRRDASAVLKQAYVRAKGIFGDRASSLRAGRFEFADGTETAPSDPTLAALKREHIAHRLIGHFGFSHVGRSFDAVQYVRSTRSGNFTFVGGRPTEGVFQLRSLKELDVDFWYGAYTRPLAGKNIASEFRVLALHYHDGRGALKTDNRTLALRRADTRNIRLTTFGGNYVAAVKTARGTVDLLAWGAGQLGSWGNLSHRAGAFVFEGGFQPGGTGFGAKLKPWLRAGYSRSTGDGDPADARHNTFFQVLPTPRIYARFPFYNMMNNEDVYAQLKLKPHARLALRAEVHGLRLSNPNDLWYVGGGAFQENSFGYVGRQGGGRKRGMGTLFDLSADFNVTPTTTLTFYGAGARGGGVQSSIYKAGGANPMARFFYAELMKRF